MRRKSLSVYLFIGLLWGCGADVFSSPAEDDIVITTIIPPESNRPSILPASYLALPAVTPLPVTYESHILSYAKRYAFSEAWVKFMLAHKNEYGVAFETMRKKQKKMEIAVYYFEPTVYATPWSSEEDHMADLEKLLEMVFVGWDFQLTLSGDKKASDAIIYLGYPSTSVCDLRTGEMWVRYEGAVVHEMGHILGLGHHYGAEAIDMLQDEDGCVMNRSGYHYCSACRAALDVGELGDTEQIDNLITDIFNRY